MWIVDIGQWAVSVAVNHDMSLAVCMYPWVRFFTWTIRLTLVGAEEEDDV